MKPNSVHSGFHSNKFAENWNTAIHTIRLHKLRYMV